MALESRLRSAWHKLPYSVRDNRLLMGLKNVVKSSVVSKSHDTQFMGRKEFPATINTLSDLDEAIAYAAYLEEKNQDLFFKFVSSFTFRPSISFDNVDPFSQEYFDRQSRVYQEVSGKTYNSKSEILPIYVQETVSTPYPYRTKSYTLTGKHLMSIGQMFTAMDIKQNARVLEMGAGHGGVTLQLAYLNCDVTTVDISKPFLDVVKYRLKQIGKKARLVACDFLEVANLDETFDAVIFNASFHHCSDHRKLIEILKTKLSSSGKFFFSNEPINPENPLPWGLRLDGESAYHIRLHGWLELGFQEKYFVDMMSKYGFSTQKVKLGEGIDPLFVCSKN